ncbi:MAG: hypothetical protein HY350_01060, partial [Candidatus Omnitrophica bacterium]|nr:hypothetical protein [Candidatus Omnitrophota bacterium]
AASEKEKAKNPYPNDFGPDTIDVSAYPEEHKEVYKLFTEKCSRCHTIARPINSQFIEVKAPDLETLKASSPQLFENPLIYQIEDNIWERYVKRMMRKPGCEMESDAAKKIWKFLVHDSKERKLKDPAAWEKHRRKLLDDFKAKYPDRYKELYESK